MFVTAYTMVFFLHIQTKKEHFNKKISRTPDPIGIDVRYKRTHKCSCDEGWKDNIKQR